MTWATLLLSAPLVLLMLWPLVHGAVVLVRRWRRRP